jgi:hypothetical protein
MSSLKPNASFACIAAVVSLSLAGLCATAAPPPAALAEPTNAEEAVRKKQAVEAGIDEKYQALVARRTAP